MQDAGINHAVRTLPRDISAFEDDAAPAGTQQARNGAQQRAFPGTVAADQGNDGAGRHNQADVLQHRDMAVADVDPVHGKQVGHAVTADAVGSFNGRVPI